MLTLTDFFCGAGGSSTGAIQVPGVVVRAAANHWKLAVDVHNANHPGAMHVLADVSQYEPSLMPPTDMAWLSPSCTKHSQAQGKKQREIDGQPDLFGQTLPNEAAERSRATMWDVVRYAEYHRYRAVIVENVLEVVKWMPYRAWLLAMDSLGYDHEILSINSMHAQHRGLPAAQSRDRFYAVFWRRGDRAPDLERIQRPQAWCPRCERVVESRKSWKPGRRVGRYRQQYVFVCGTVGCGALVEPGWLPAASIIDWTLPGARIGDRNRPLAEKTRARIAAGIARYWLDPFLVERRHEYRVRGVGDPPLDRPLRTQTTRLETGVVAPFIAELRGGGSDARAVAHPLSTVTASGNHHGLVTPYYGATQAAASTDHPLSTVTTVDPMRTLHTREAYALLMRNNSGGAEMTTPVTEVARTITTAGHQSLITPTRQVTPDDLAAAADMVDDCLFRMLEPSEAARGMAFPDDYEWDGTRRERTRLAGNAVTPPAARDLVGAVAEALT